MIPKQNSPSNDSYDNLVIDNSITTNKNGFFKVMKISPRKSNIS